jgi:thymidine kinase
MRGKLIYKFGTMGSGKSLQLLATAHNFQIHQIPFLILKSTIDTRDGENVIHSRALGDRECVGITPENDIYAIIAEYLDITAYTGERIRWILVDEAQFLTESQVEQLAAICDNLGINVICYGLRTDFRSKLFPGSKRLFELADSFEEIKSSCFCGNKTIFNARMNGNKEIVVDGDQIDVGGDDKYVSLCRKCYFEKIGYKYWRKNNNEE